MKPLMMALTLLVALVFSQPARSGELRLAVTTSFHNSGLSDVLLPAIKRDLGIEVRLLVVGTGQALRLAKAGDVDAVLVHSPAAERQFVSDGFASHRRKIMFNDFVLVGPSGDPAAIGQSKSAAGAFKRLAGQKAIFLSRGDDSGTHRKELSIWRAAEIDVQQGKVNWYREAGSGMAATLNTASGMNAYTFTDRASWLKFNNKGDLKLLYSGDVALFNQYAFLPVNPGRHPHVKAELNRTLESWLAGPKGQSLIGNYQLAGEKLFTPNAQPE